jgi:hypothetical protein
MVATNDTDSLLDHISVEISNGKIILKLIKNDLYDTFNIVDNESVTTNVKELILLSLKDISTETFLYDIYMGNEFICSKSILNDTESHVLNFDTAVSGRIGVSTKNYKSSYKMRFVLKLL